MAEFRASIEATTTRRKIRKEDMDSFKDYSSHEEKLSPLVTRAIEKGKRFLEEITRDG